MVDKFPKQSIDCSPIGTPEVHNEENLSTQKEDPQNRTRIFQKDGNDRRTTCTLPSSTQGPHSPDLLIQFRPHPATRFTPNQRKISTLKKSRQFDRVFKHGRSLHRDGIVLYTVRANHRGLRMGFCVSSKVGGAVTRNHLRRRLREVIRLQRHEVIMGFDCIVLARESILKSDFVQLQASFADLGRRSGILTQAGGTRKERTR